MSTIAQLETCKIDRYFTLDKIFPFKNEILLFRCI